MGKAGFKVFDSDMHIMEPPDLWERYLDPEFRSMAPVGVTSENVRDLRLRWPNKPLRTGVPHRGRNYEKNQLIYADHAARGWSPQAQLDAMDAEGLDVAVLFPSRGLSVLTRPDLERRFAAAIARAYNDWLHEFCQGDPHRMLGAGMISLHDVGDAVEETHRVIEQLGFRAVFARANIIDGKPPWDDPYYEPLWNTLEKLEIPLGLHEASGSWSRQTGDHYTNVGLRRIVAQPFEQMLAFNNFIAGGVLERHPKLRVAFLEANCSWVPWLVWRMDEFQELEGDNFMPDLELRPSDYFRRQCFVSVEPDETPVRSMLETFGSDQLVFSTDYPHGDSRYPKAVETFLELPLTDEERRNILWDNCADFYAVTEVVAP